jgi:hypothetical protein
VIGYPKHSPQQKSGFVGFEEKFFCSWNENNPKKRAGAMGYYPTEGHCELNPGAAATPACDREISWSSRFSVSGRRKGKQAEA